MRYRHLYSTASIQAALMQDPPETDQAHRHAAKTYYQRAISRDHSSQILRLALQHANAILLPTIEDDIFIDRIRYKLDARCRRNGEEVYELATVCVFQTNYLYAVSKLNIAAAYYRSIHNRTLYDREMLVKIELIIAYCYFRSPTTTNFHQCFIQSHIDTAQALSYLIPNWRASQTQTMLQAQAEYLTHLISRNLYAQAPVDQFIALVNDYIIHPPRSVSVHMSQSLFATPFSSLVYHSDNTQLDQPCRIS